MQLEASAAQARRINLTSSISISSCCVYRRLNRVENPRETWSRQIFKIAYRRELRVCREYDTDASNSMQQPSSALMLQPGLGGKLDCQGIKHQ